MKRYILLSFVSFATFAFLVYLFLNGESALKARHQDVLNLFITAKQVDASVDKDLLESKSFLTSTYDALVNAETEFSAVCESLKGSNVGLYRTQNEFLDASIDKYCEATDEKVRLIEQFKSKNAIFKNSIYFIHDLEVQLLSHGQVPPADIPIARALTAGIAYSIVASKGSRQTLEMLLKRAGGSPRHEVARMHVQKVLELKEEIDELTEEIISPELSESLEGLRNQYFLSYDQSESKAASYRRIIFGISAFFLIFVVYNIVSLWRAARALTDANETLESKVEKRTRELRDSQDTIIQQQQTLVSSAKMLALGEMAGGVAHEINTPLAVMMMRIEQLQEAVQEGEYQEKDVLSTLLILKNTTDRISKIVTGLRLFARDGRRTAAQPAVVTEIVDDTLSFCGERFKSLGVTVEKDYSRWTDSQLSVECRSVEISQILLNLLNNAFDVAVARPEKWIRIELIPNDDYLELAVRDAGSVPQEVRSRLMNPFFTTKGVGKGTGLGLSISRGLAEGHSGQLFLDEQSAQTRFVLRLPWTQSKAESKAA